LALWLNLRLQNRPRLRGLAQFQMLIFSFMASNVSILRMGIKMDFSEENVRTNYRQQKQKQDTWLDYVGHGFWIAVGFTPAFVIISGLMYLAFLKLSVMAIDHELGVRISSTQERQKAMAREIEKLPPIQALHESLRKGDPSVEGPHIAQIGPSQLSEADRAEQVCSIAVLNYSQTQTEKDKQAMYAACPDK